MIAAKRVFRMIAAGFISDRDNSSALLIVIGSIAAGLMLFLLMPMIILFSAGNIQPPGTGIQFEEAAFLSQLTPEQSEKIRAFESAGQTIAQAMEEAGLQEQTIKAQLIFLSYFGDSSPGDITAYAAHFTQEDAALIHNLNTDYGLEIDFDSFMRTYTMVMNSTINEYMFTDPEEKNAADLAAWCRNALVSGWRYADYTIGERTGADRIRCADNVGLIMGYVRYDALNRCFSDSITDMYYTIRGSIDTIPDIQGVGVFNGTEFGVYTGSGQVVFSSAIGGVQCEALADGNWTDWCPFEAVSYPEEITEPETGE